MFCPLCQSEYREGITRCSDCKVDLVTSIPTSPEPISDPEARIIWEGVDHRRFSEIIGILDTEKIPHTTELPQFSILYPSQNAPLQIRVLSTDYDHARTLLYGPDENEDDYEDEIAKEDEQSSTESPRKDKPMLGIFSFDDEESPESRNDIVGEWFAEDATCEVWTGNVPGMPKILHDCLQEIGIGSRDEIVDGTTHLYVYPADEQNAREVIRQVVEGVPPA
jgi:hypothetical protein